MAVRPVGHASQAEYDHPVDLGVGLRPAGDQHQVLAAGEPRGQGRGLDQAADLLAGLAADRGSRPSSRTSPVPAWRSPRGHLQGGRLAGPVRPDSPYSSPSRPAGRGRQAPWFVRSAGMTPELTAAVAGLLYSAVVADAIEHHGRARSGTKRRHEVVAARGRPGHAGRDPGGGIDDPAVPGRMLEILHRRSGRRDLATGFWPCPGARHRRGAGVRRPAGAAVGRRPGRGRGGHAALTESWPTNGGGWPPPSARWPCCRLRLAGLARDATGYPGPLGPALILPRRLAPLRPRATRSWPATWSWSAWSGRRVMPPGRPGPAWTWSCWEKGGYRAGSDFTHQEGDAYRDSHQAATTLTTDDLGCRILAGSTLGGGTVVNYSTSFVTPPAVLAEWAATSGVQAFVNGEVKAAVEAVASASSTPRAVPAPGTGC